MLRDGTTRVVENAFEGTVSHSRQYDVRHQFRYRLWMALARLGNSELPRLLRPNFNRYLSSSEALSLFSADVADSEVWLLTQPSLFGRSFNPVSFYFLVRDGQLIGVLGHITNTPWDETHCYALEQSTDNVWIFDKEFHVSPFMPMALRYVWRFEVEGDRILITMQLLDKGERIFAAALNLKAAGCSWSQACRLRLRYPCQNLLTLSRIYWQALLLKIKGARFHAHPDQSATASTTSH